MICRELLPEDMPRLLPCARQFFLEAGVPGKFSGDHFCNSWAGLMLAGAGYIAALDPEDGDEFRGAVGMVFWNDFSQESLIGHETFWYVQPAFRGLGGSLFKAVEAEWKRRGAAGVYFGHLDNPESEIIGRLYRRKGFRPSERYFVKDLTQCV